MFKKKKIVLALGGGAARGLCNVGALKVFEENFGKGKMPFDLIIGSSIGSLIGAGYCAGIPILELEEMAVRFNWPKLVDFGLNPTGLLKGSKLENIIIDMLGDRSFIDLKIPFAVTTTDIQTGEELLHTDGDLVKLIRASCSWPGFFSSVEIDGRLLGDGGIRHPIPTKAAKHLGATFIVAVNPGFAVSRNPIDNALKALIQSIQIMGEEITSIQAKAADIAIKPNLEDIDQFDFDKAQHIVKQGEIAAVECLPELNRKISLHSMLNL